GKPYRDFPLFKHATGQWAKKIKGKLRYFGTDPDAALEKYIAERDELQAGRNPRIPGNQLTVADLANQFLNAKRAKVESGELSRRTWGDYFHSCELLTSYLGKTALVLSLTPQDFERLRAKLAKTNGPVGLGNQIHRIRAILKYAFDAE